VGGAGGGGRRRRCWWCPGRNELNKMHDHCMDLFTSNNRNIICRSNHEGVGLGRGVCGGWGGGGVEGVAGWEQLAFQLFWSKTTHKTLPI
jgi:hypothetical protein